MRYMVIVYMNSYVHSHSITFKLVHVLQTIYLGPQSAGMIDRYAP
jgi:hypothetical protein